MTDREETGRRPVVRHEEELELGTTVEEVGGVRARKLVDVERAEGVVPRLVENVDDLERIQPGENDSGEVEVLDDGSVSIPVFEEELVVTKRLVVRERVVVRKRAETEEQRVEADLRRERVEVETEGDVEVAEKGSH